MAAISSFRIHPLSSPSKIPSFHATPIHISSCSHHYPSIRIPSLRSHGLATYVKHQNRSGMRKIRSVAEETPAIEEQNSEEGVSADQPVSVPVSPSDKLIMFFQAEGTMNETAIPTVTKALQVIEGVADLKVQLIEGIASVELTKQTTVQATGVASSLVETIQGSGFKLQTLNLGFEDEETTNS